MVTIVGLILEQVQLFKVGHKRVAFNEKQSHKHNGYKWYEHSLRYGIIPAGALAVFRTGLEVFLAFILTRQCVVLQPLLRRVMLEYGSREAASYALDKLHGFEYPPGKKIVVKTEYEQRGDG